MFLHVPETIHGGEKLVPTPPAKSRKDAMRPLQRQCDLKPKTKCLVQQNILVLFLKVALCATGDKCYVKS